MNILDQPQQFRGKQGYFFRGVLNKDVFLYAEKENKYGSD